MKTTKEILESKFGNPLSDYVGEDQLWIVDNIVAAMKEYAKEVLKDIFEDGLGNIDQNQSITDIIKSYQKIELK